MRLWLQSQGACKMAGGVQNMVRRATRRACAVAMGLACLAGVGSSAHAQTPNKIPDAIKGLDVVEKLGQRVPLNLELIDPSGKKVKLGDWFNQDKPVLLLMLYFRCPMQCPFTLDRYVTRMREIPTLEIGKDYNVVIVSFDPTEGPAEATKEQFARVAAYGRGVDAEVKKSFAFLTHPDGNVTRALADSVGFGYRYLPESNEFAHPSAAFILMPDGRISRYLYGMDVPSRDLRLSLVEASEGKIGGFSEKILLFCFHFDPDKGSYELMAWRVMQIGGGVTVVVVGGLVVAMLQLEKRRKRREAAARGAGVVGLGSNGVIRIGEQIAAERV
jgi:protein SCO1